MRLLTRNASVAAALLGALALGAGAGWVLALVAFFVSSTVLSRVGEARKFQRTQGIVEKHGARDVSQVLANGGVFGFAAAGSLLFPSPGWMVLGAGAIAASAADTWATEIGTLSSDVARSIPGFEPVPAGTSGAVTFTGTTAALAGALFIAGVVAIAGWPVAAVQAAVAGGFAGSVLDSLLGASLQATRWCDQCGVGTERAIHVCGSATRHERGVAWMTNDLVNAIGSLGGAATAALWLL